MTTRATQARLGSTATRLARALALMLTALLVLGACSSNSSVTLSSDTDATTGDPADSDSTGDSGTNDEGGSADPDDAGTNDEGGSADAATNAPDDDDAGADDDDSTASSGGGDDGDTDDSSDDGDSDESEGGGDVDFSGADSDDFCRIAREIDENNPFDDETLSPFSENFFAEVLDFYSKVEAIAPPEIADDFATIRAGLEQLQAAAVQFDYNLFDPGFSEAVDAIDTTDMDAAAARIEAYLLEICGLDISGANEMGAGPTSAPPGAPVPDAMLDALGDIDLENVSEEDLAVLNQLIFAQLNLDPAVQACLLENLDVLAAVGDDPSLLTQPICGTTLLNIFSGLG